MNEDRLAALLSSLFKGGRDFIGIGDDAAVLPYKKGEKLLFTTDTIIEGRHFIKNRLSPYYIGRKAMAVNISDIAAMGGEPLYAVVNLGIKKLDKVFVSKLYRGIKNIAEKYDIKIVGGDTVKSNSLFLAIAMVGKVKSIYLLTRSGAKVGDAIYVTGTIGGAASSSKHYKFNPRLKEAQWLSSNFKINSMIDITDGLILDLSRLCKASDKGAILDKRLIPLSARAASFSSAVREGEDFELLFTASGKSNIPGSIPGCGLKVRSIGNITEKRGGILIQEAGRMRKVKVEGYDHFK
ncbi:MAG: thiamine-phosphate kinase [Candidatus Kaelpia aquatica]|nr:thiamine-phosphate kinase [Candidatus Kaelpia aquatica]